MEDQPPYMKDRSWDIVTMVSVAFIAVAWLMAQSNIAIPGDMAWLSLAAEKFLSGEKMTDAFHDNNPPLCYLIYIPVAAFTALCSLPVAAFIYSAGIVFLFTALLAVVARKGAGIKGREFAALIIGYLLPLAFMFQGEFGNKDYLIAAALLPFLMAQFAVTYNKNAAPGWHIWLTCALATPFILLKPHYGLLPVCLLLHRFVKGRGFGVLRDPDFICLSAGTLLYALASYIWFQDYFSEVFWSVSVNLYADIVMNDVFKHGALMALLSASMIVLAFCSDAQGADKKMALLLSTMAFLCVIPFVAQMKGFSLHMIPYLSLSCPAFMVLVMQYLGRGRAQLAAFIAIILAVYALSLTTPQAKPQDFRNADFSKIIQEHATDGHGFLMQDSTTNISIPIAVYTQKPHASRFSSLWFVRHLANSEDPALTDSYATMVAEDLDRYKPGVVLLYHDPQPHNDLLKVFAANEDFQRAWSAYHRESVVPLNVQEFYKRGDALLDSYESYDLYVRR